MIKRVEPLTKRHRKKGNNDSRKKIPSHSASWAFVVGCPVDVVVVVVVGVATFCLLLVDNVVIYDNFIVLSTCCPFYFRLCLLLIYYHPYQCTVEQPCTPIHRKHTQTREVGERELERASWLLCSILLCARRYQTFSALLL